MNSVLWLIVLALAVTAHGQDTPDATLDDYNDPTSDANSTPDSTPDFSQAEPSEAELASIPGYPTPCDCQQQQTWVCPQGLGHICPPGPHCKHESCKPAPPTEGSFCISKDPCRPGPGTCQHGVCVGKYPKICKQNKSCKLRKCNPHTGHCEDDGNKKVGTRCSDGKFCTVNDKCNRKGKCVGKPRVCKSTDPCITKKCNEMKNKCVPDKYICPSPTPSPEPPSPSPEPCPDNTPCEYKTDSGLTLTGTCNATGSCADEFAPAKGNCSANCGVCCVPRNLVCDETPQGNTCDAGSSCVCFSSKNGANCALSNLNIPASYDSSLIDQNGNGCPERNCNALYKQSTGGSGACCAYNCTATPPGPGLAPAPAPEPV